MNYSAIVLSGGLSRRFGANKSLVGLLGKPMITYVVDTVIPLVDEVLIITDTEENRDKLSKVFDSSVRILLDEYDLQSPVVGALTGFKHARNTRSLLLSCDIPLISFEVITLLLKLSEDYDAVIPKWPNGYIEPLQAVYATDKAYEASLGAIIQSEFRMINIITRLPNVLNISTIVLSKIDPKLNTFLNVNTPNDLIMVEEILKNG